MSKYRWGPTSIHNLGGVHPYLRMFADLLLERHDCRIVGGGRTVLEQRERVAEGVSKTQDSKHLRQPDGYYHAIDIHPIVDGKLLDPANPRELNQWFLFAGMGLVLGNPSAKGFSIRWGGDWDKDYNNLDNNFQDLFHWEISFS